ncbi:polymorphic toxin-type HINT domain-containing protein [Streptomyces acidiscabies]|uniref:polymorphic toxin-type HINT domain-containing protein n=1 Tax=Streptomyces acidiscabies TaxID=42234 RepID=UPI00067C174F|nr:polymorphic toxin-type HINT domain-containing protein [Streptomyces acidiscabies]
MADEIPDATVEPNSRSSRQQVVDTWATSGTEVRAAAETALLGTDDDVVAFLADYADLRTQDYRVEAAQLASFGGENTLTAVRQALAGPETDLVSFMKGGWKEPLQQDQRVLVARIVDVGGPEVQARGRAALNGTDDDVQKFLEAGRTEAQKQDDRVLVTQLIAAGGTQVKAAGRLALTGTADDIREFLEVGQFVARSRDEEYATVAELAAQAERAGKLASAQTKAAQNASKEAVEASKQAKDAAAQAAKEAEATKQDSAAAANAANRAASAASGAAKAAQRAISAANAASQSARIASAAASQAAAAAVGAANAAANARNAAAAAATDASQADAAKKAAVQARTAAQGATKAADAADQAVKAAISAGQAAISAASAGANAASAADAAVTASQYAGQGSAAAANARAAAEAAHRQAAEANRAASAAESLAAKAATAAGEARDAARSAATHAQNAATAAEDAAQHAGEASAAAARSTAHANAATEAANVASKAAEQARNVYTLTRQIETEELLGRTNAGIANARDLKAEEQAEKSRRTAQAEEAREARRTADDLASKAQQGVDDAEIARLGRQLALADLKSGKPWLRAAAQNALGAPTDGVVAYVRTGRAEAQAQDDRADVERLAEESAVKAVRDAAEQALDGDAAAVSAFLSEGQYTAGREAFRVAVAQAADAGGPVVKDQARAALNTGTTEAYRTFLTSTLAEAQEEDDRVRAAQLIDSGTPEIQAAARIALESPAALLHQFVESGQYTAQRRDLLALTHGQQILQLVAEAAQVAATAQKDAANANATAATARKAAADAQQWALKAQQSATQAAGYAKEADQHAKDAAASAQQAAQSARTARTAAERADRSAQQAAVSASDATVSAELAQNSASIAWAASNAAQVSAERAGKSADEAKAVAKDTLVIAIAKHREEEEERRRAAVAQKEAQEKQGTSAAELYRCGFLGCEAQKNPGRWCQHHEAYCDVLAQAPLVKAFGDALEEFDKTILGLSQLESCVSKHDLESCWELQRDVMLSSKLRALGIAYDALRNVTRGCTQCFLPGTRVLMADGTTKPIEQVQAGDLVHATDPVTGESGARTVSQQIVTHDDKYLSAITIRGPTGDRADITATYDHPFWNVGLRTWAAASDLRPGDALRTDSGATATVLANRSFEREATTHSLTVEGLHSFYVLAGDTPLLVHNSECKVLVLGLSDHLKEEAAKVKGGYHLMDPKYAVVEATLPGGIPFTKWMAQVNATLSGNQRVVVSLKGFRPEIGTYQQKFNESVERARSGRWSATDWEMGRIAFYYHMGDLDWKNVTFLDDTGEVIKKMDPPPLPSRRK